MSRDTDAEKLHHAAMAGDAQTVRELLRARPSLAAFRAEDGETPAVAALYRGHRELANELADAMREHGPLDVFIAAALGRREDLQSALAAAPCVNSHSYDGWTPLHLAAFFGHREIAEALVAAGADLGVTSHNALKNTPLHAAVAGGHVEVSLLLIERGADVNRTDAGGHTPLHIAAEAGYVPVVEALLDRGADAHAVDAEDKTPLSRAAARNHDAVVDAINLSR